MVDQVVTSFAVPNYSGMLFNKGNTRVPFSTIIGPRRKQTNHVEFAVGQYYTSDGGTQPEISETASLTAPAATRKTRTQFTNVTQIFHESVYISDAKRSNMGTLSGINVAGQQANPANELDFQVAAKMQQIARDIEYTFIRGDYNKATNDGEANKTRGILNAITTSVKDMGNKPLTLWAVNDGLKKVYDAQAPTTGLLLWVDPTTMFQINADAQKNGMTIVNAGRTINGIQVRTLITPMGEIGLHLGQFLPSGTAMIWNPEVVGPVEQPVPGKGNFYMEPLGKTGAGDKYQIFGQLGLDHGPEWYHMKFENISTEFTEPISGVATYDVTPDE